MGLSEQYRDFKPGDTLRHKPSGETGEVVETFLRNGCRMIKVKTEARRIVDSRLAFEMAQPHPSSTRTARLRLLRSLHHSRMKRKS